MFSLYPPCVRMQIQSGCVVLCTVGNVRKVHQRAKGVAFRVVDVVFWEFVALEAEMSRLNVSPPCVRTQIQSGCIVVGTWSTTELRVVAFSLVDVLPLGLVLVSGKNVWCEHLLTWGGRSVGRPGVCCSVTMQRPCLLPLFILERGPSCLLCCYEGGLLLFLHFFPHGSIFTYYTVYQELMSTAKGGSCVPT